MYGFTNDAGEPIMDAAAYRYEQYIDSQYEPDPDDYYASDWNDSEEYIPSEQCDHSGDKSYPQGAGMKCDDCLETYEGPTVLQGPLDFPAFMSRDIGKY